MPLDALIALLGLALAATWTPGPNNVLLANSGASFGFRPTVPHALGVALGFPAMIFVLALGLGEVFRASPALREALRWGGVALLLWLGWRIATASRAAGAAEGRRGAGRGRPFTFLEAAAFQWVNPKAWAMALAAAAAFVSGTAPIRDALICAGVFALSGLGSANAWAAFGAGIRRLLASETRLRVFNVAMGALLALFALWLALSDI